MPLIDSQNRKIIVDDDGFLQNPEDWNEIVASALALSDGIKELTSEHWLIINYLRNYFKQFGVVPMIKKLCTDTGFTLKKIYELFPSGPSKGACKVAGLSKVPGCV